MATDFAMNINQPANGPVVDGALVANGVPAVASDAHASVGMWDHIDVVLAESGGGTFDAKVWWFYAPAGVWVEDLNVGTLSVAANGTAGATLQQSAASAVYVEVLNVAGGARCSGWLIGRGKIR